MRKLILILMLLALAPVAFGQVTALVGTSNPAADLSVINDNFSYLDGREVTATVTLTIDGGGSAITTGDKTWVQIPFAATITNVEMTADQSGSVVVDIWVDTYANYPPTVADTIAAAAKPTISTAIKSTDSTLTGWTKTVAAGSYMKFSVDSAATIERLVLVVTMDKT